MIRVAVVDDRIVIDGMEKIVTESGIACLAGKAFSVVGCLAMPAKEQPDVLLLDVGLPDGSGMDLCPQIKAKYPAMNILMLTGYAEYAIISHVLNNGASGYILKNATSEEIVEGIRNGSRWQTLSLRRNRFGTEKIERQRDHTRLSGTRTAEAAGNRPHDP